MSEQLKTTQAAGGVEVVSLKDVLPEVFDDGERVKVADILDRDFVVVRYRFFPSRFRPGEEALFLVGEFVDTGERFNTIVGSARVLDVFRLLRQRGLEGGVRMRFVQRKGGRYGRFYDVE